MKNYAHSLSLKAEEAREKGNFSEALKYCDEALLAYQEENNAVGFAEILSSRFLTLRHLYEQTEDEQYMILAKHTVMASAEIARKSDNEKALAIPLFNLGKAHETLGEYQQAINNYREAIANLIQNPPPGQDRVGIMHEMIIHLSFAEYQTGDKSALERLKKAIERLAATDEPIYNKDVWMSGGYMDIAEMLQKDNPDKAKLALDRAKEIIDANPDLILRKRQLTKLATKLGFPLVK